MAASAVLEHELAYVHRAGAVGNAVAHGDYRVLLLEPPEDLDADVAVLEHDVGGEAVARVNFLLVA